MRFIMVLVRTVVALMLLLFLGAIAIFAFQNDQSITVKFLDRSLTAPLALAAVAVYVLGMISGWSVLAFLRGSFRRVTEDPRSDL